jgi:hypothetical protein
MVWIDGGGHKGTWSHGPIGEASWIAAGLIANGAWVVGGQSASCCRDEVDDP